MKTTNFSREWALITLLVAGITTASELHAGMYLYSLIADGKEVDTKRMILTE